MPKYRIITQSSSDPDGKYFVVQTYECTPRDVVQCVADQYKRINSENGTPRNFVVQESERGEIWFPPQYQVGP